MNTNNKYLAPTEEELATAMELAKANLMQERLVDQITDDMREALIPYTDEELADMRKEAIADIRADLEVEMRATLIPELRAEIHARFRAEVLLEFKADLKNGLKEKLDEEALKEIASDARKAVTSEVRKEFMGQQKTGQIPGVEYTLAENNYFARVHNLNIQILKKLPNLNAEHAMFKLRKLYDEEKIEYGSLDD